jgi:hypothetical protein
VAVVQTVPELLAMFELVVKPVIHAGFVPLR